jgi:hypothetical protein
MTKMTRRVCGQLTKRMTQQRRWLMRLPWWK